MDTIIATVESCKKKKEKKELVSVSNFAVREIDKH